MLWLWIVLGVLVTVPVLLGLILFALYWHLRWNYGHYLVRIFQEKPLFIIPRGQPVANAEDVEFRSTNGLALRGCYLKTPARHAPAWSSSASSSARIAGRACRTANTCSITASTFSRSRCAGRAKASCRPATSRCSG